MATKGDSIAPPRKRLTTYGKAVKRRPAEAEVTQSSFNPFAGDIWDPVDDAPASVVEAPKRVPAQIKTARPIAPVRSQASQAPQAPRAQAERRLAEPKSRKPAKETTRTYGTKVQVKSLPVSQSQPALISSTSTLTEPDSQQTKKRKLTRTVSAHNVSAREKSAGLYSTPDSSPTGAHSPTSATESEQPNPGVRSPPSSQSTPRHDVAMRDADLTTQNNPFSAKTTRTLDNLAIQGKSAQRKEIPLRLGNPAKAQARPAPALAPLKPQRANSSSKVAKKPAATSKSSEARPAAPRKKRLIDVLAEQAEVSSTDETDSSDKGEGTEEEDELALLGKRVSRATRSTPPPIPQPQPQSALRVRAPPMGKKPGPKFTYGQQRTILAEPQPEFGGTAGLGADRGFLQAPLFDFASLANTSTTNAFSFMDEDDDTANTGAVRTIHELRQAGANSRFGDEMDDILDRISAPTAKPSSLRRGALLELAQKAQGKDFRRQFRNHGEGGLFKHVGEETDIVGGYAIVATLVTLFASSTSAHLVPQLLEQGIMALLSRFLGETSDILVLARDRKMNVSKNGQITLASIKTAVLKLPIWEPAAPTSLPPRTLALKCLDLLLRHSIDPTAEDEMFTPAVTGVLFSILSASMTDEKYWDFPAQHESTDLHAALSLLESHSVNAMQSQLGLEWTSQYVPIIADVLAAALRRPATKFDQLESLILRLTLNATNNNSDAAGIFVDNGLLKGLAETACSTFDVLFQSMKEGNFLAQTLESLILMLGVMINFCEHYSPAAQSLDDDDDESPLVRLIRAFLDNCSTTSDADSMEKTHFNVAFAYLSIFLGCLCLERSIQRTFLRLCPQRSLQPLVSSIKEFIVFQKMAAKAMEGEGQSRHESGATERLEKMVQQLERR